MKIHINLVFISAHANNGVLVVFNLSSEAELGGHVTLYPAKK